MADFGDPSTWEMNVDQFIDSGLPKEKPPELLDIQEQNRKQRLLQSLQRIGGGLEDSSLDFIRRENFSDGSFKDSIREAEKAVAEFEKKNNRVPYPKELPKVIGKSRSQMYRILKASNKNLTTPFPQGEEGVLMKKNIAEGNKSIKKGMNIIKADYKKFKKTALPNQKYYVGANLISFKNVDGNTVTLSGNPKTRNKIIDNLMEEGLDIIRVENASGAIGGENITGGLSKEERNHFKKNYKNKSLGEMTRKFLPEGTGTTTAAYDKKIHKFRMYKNNLVDQKIIKDEDLIKPLEFEPKAPGQAGREFRKRRGDDLKKLGVKNQEDWLASLKREIADEIYGKKAFATDAKGKIRVRIDQGHRAGYDQFKKLGAKYSISTVGPDLDDINRKNIKLVENKLKPLYQKQVSLFNKAKKNLTPELKKSIGANNDAIAELVAKAQFDDPKIKGRIVGVQVDPFNLKVGTTPVDYTKALDLGVLDDAIRIGVGTEGKIDKLIIKENYKSLLLKEGAEQGFLNKEGKKAINKEFKKIIASVSPNKNCQGKFNEGGPVNIDQCFLEGKKAINDGKIAKGAQSRNFAKFANKAMEIGKQSGRGLRTIGKFGILPEMVILGVDTAIRAGSGATFDEAFKKASDIYRTDEAYEKANELEVRRIDPANADIILNLRKFNNERAKLDSLRQEKEADLALAGNDFAETDSGMTYEETENFHNPRIQKQENNLFNASISDAEERAGLAKEAEFEDKRGVLDKQSPIGKRLDALAEVRGFKQVVDLFNTGTVQQPDVSAQAIDNYAPDAFKKTIQKYGPQVTLDVIKKFEAEQEYPEGAVRNKNLQDEERRLLFEAAKNDPALAELYFGPSMTFAGDPIDQTDLQDEMNLDRGIYSQGGRIGFKDGPKNPGRRTFMKLAAGIASIPIFGKFFKPAVPLVKKLANSSTVMPDWFPNFVDKFIGRSIGKKIDADLWNIQILIYQILN